MSKIDFFLKTIIVLCIVQLVEIQKNNLNRKIPHKFYISQHIDEDFEDYLVDFLEDANKYQLPKIVAERYGQLTIKYGIMPKSETDRKFSGWCERTTRTIIIDKKSWHSYNMNSRQALIDHELGHCLLDKPHRHKVTKSEKGIAPHSVMYPDLIDGEFYANNKEFLRNELLGNKKSLGKFQKTYDLAEKYKDLIILFENDVDAYVLYFENLINGDLTEEEKEKLIVSEEMNNNT